MESQLKGPAETIIQTTTQFVDHLVHHRPGVVRRTVRTAPIPVEWSPVITRDKDGIKTVFVKEKQNKALVEIGVLQQNMNVVKNGSIQGRYAPPGFFQEVAVFLYKQVVDVWKLNETFVAHWASYAFTQDNRDLKVVLAAFLLVQPRKGQAVVAQGKLDFYDDNYREVAEAMMLSDVQKHALNPKQLLLVYEFLKLPEIAQINRDLGFTKSQTRPFFGNWQKAVHLWLRYRETNPRVLDGLVRAGFKRTVKTLVQLSRYKPLTAKFFEALGWAQKQGKHGKREFLGVVKTSQSWEKWSEQKICDTIVAQKLNYKVVMGKLPKQIGLTPAILAAVIEAKGLSVEDFVILTPSLESLGLLQNTSIKTQWEAAIKQTESMRAKNIALRVNNRNTANQLTEVANKVLQDKVTAAVKDLTIYFMIDISGSMTSGIEAAKQVLPVILQAFPPERTFAAVFETAASVLKFKTRSESGVAHALSKFKATGGTSHRAGLKALFNQYPPQPSSEVILFVVGDQGDSDNLSDLFQALKVNLAGIFFLCPPGAREEKDGVLTKTSRTMGVPLIRVDTALFDDPYALPQRFTELLKTTPVTARAVTTARQSLVDLILNTPLLKKPSWA